MITSVPPKFYHGISEKTNVADVPYLHLADEDNRTGRKSCGQCEKVDGKRGSSD